MPMTAAREPLYRRHLPACRHRTRGRGYTACACPVHCDFINTAGKRVQQSMRTTSWSTAQSKLAIMERTGVAALHSLQDALRAWDEALVAQRLKDSTLVYYRRLAGQLQAFCDAQGLAALEQITTDALDRFRSSRKAIATTTSTKELTTLKVFFRYCCDRGWIAANPASVIKAPKARPSDKTPYTEAEVIKILAACDDTGTNDAGTVICEAAYGSLRRKAAILVMLNTGMRISDVVTLRRDEIRDGVLTRQTIKTGGFVRIQLPKEVIDALALLPVPNGAPADCPYYFWSGKGKRGTAIVHFQGMLRKVYRRAGIVKGISHRFRHTMASRLLATNTSPKHVAMILGISVAVVMKHYDRYIPEHQDRIDEAMQRLNRDSSASLSATQVFKVQ